VEDAFELKEDRRRRASTQSKSAKVFELHSDIDQGRIESRVQERQFLMMEGRHVDDPVSETMAGALGDLELTTTTY
jgi:hypothetical protein